MGKGTDQERPGCRKKVWQAPEIKEVGDLRTLVQALNPGKPSIGRDGGGGGGGEEMIKDS